MVRVHTTRQPPNTFFGPATIASHKTGVSWRKTKKGHLVVRDGNGHIIARYKANAWTSVWIEGEE